ncbi:MAG: hypothetical protein H0V42_10975, partial [Nocardioidaceae bacterium]|nr:hypothetical protein [Nocardioidaceae bacterium]
MDKSTFRHHLSVAGWDEWHFHAFVRSDDGNIEHYWPSDDQVSMFGPEDLGGRFDSDPIAVWRATSTTLELHLIGRSGMELIDWSWPHAQVWGRTLLLGAPTVQKLPAFAVADPEVMVSGRTIHLFAPSLDGPMRHWFSESVEGGWSGQEVLSEHPASHDVRPCAVLRAPGTLDLFSVDGETSGLRRWFLDADGWRSEDLSPTPAGRKLAGRPTAVSFAPDRLDVFAVREDGVPVHWGWDGTTWFGPEQRLGGEGVLPGDLQLLSTDEKQLTLVARHADAAGQPQLLSWTLDPGQGEWRGPHGVGPCPF